jgi:S-adenosylmethionine hydrolase
MAILTMTTDMGQRDYLVGAIKGQFLNLLPALNIVDITHYLSQTNFPLAAYVCSNAFRYYPRNSFHLVLVNLFAAPVRHMLMAKHEGQYIICPDNGLLTMITGVKPKEIVAITMTARPGLLDITARLAEKIALFTETEDMADAGSTIDQIEERYPLRPMVGPDWIEGQILFIDQFENVVINITRTEFEEVRQNRKFKIMFTRNESIERISDNYTDVSETEKLAWFNSAGYLEIALRNGNMAGLFGLQGFREQSPSVPASSSKWFYQTVRVFFE